MLDYVDRLLPHKTTMLLHKFLQLDTAMAGLKRDRQNKQF